MNRRIALVLILILTASSLIVVKPTHSSITKPSVPEFTVKLVDSSYDVPTSYSIDPYTGENVTHAGRHVESRTIEVKIKNQPFVPYNDTSSGWAINFYYNIRIKGHYIEDWRELFRASDGYPTQSDSDYTVISYQGEYSPTEGMDFTSQTIMTKFPSGGQVDFQVEAMIGYVSRAGEPPWYPWRFTGETSGWSETQTLTINARAPITTPNGRTASPDEGATSDDGLQHIEQLTAILGAVITAIVVSAALGLLLYFKKRQRSQSS